MTTHAFASSDESLWPEFRQWYALMLQQEQIHIKWSTEELDADDRVYNAAIDNIVEEMCPLEETMRARHPRSEANRAALACLALYWLEKVRDRKNAERYLVLGCASEDPVNCFDPAATALIEATVADAVSRNLLPGIRIWREGEWTEREIA